jgi:hypothetical protein
MKKLILICIIFSTLISIVPNTIAFYDFNSEEINDKIDSGIMIGIMHVHFEKKGWGWVEKWQPILIYRFGLNTSNVLGPTSGYFIPQNFIGLIGALYFVHSFSLDSGYFFICARVKVYQ